MDPITLLDPDASSLLASQDLPQAGHLSDLLSKGNVAYSPSSGDIHDSGFAVPAYPETAQETDGSPQDIHDYLVKHQDYFGADPQAALLGHDDGGKKYLHVTHHEPDIQAAIAKANSLGAKGVHDLSTGENLATRLPTTGAEPDNLGAPPGPLDDLNDISHGLGQGIGDTIAGVASTLQNPVETVSSLAQAAKGAITDPVQAGKAIYQGLKGLAAKAGSGLAGASEVAGGLLGSEAKPLTEAEKVIEARFAAQLAADHPGALADYAAHPETKGGKVLNTDIARELSPDYNADRSQSAAVHEPASDFIKNLYAQKLTEPLKPGEANKVVFTAGGTGSGKSSAVNTTHDVDNAQIVYDTNMNKLPSAIGKIQQAMDAGKQVAVNYVYRDPVDALVNGALTRAMGQVEKHGSGRTVPLYEHLNTHVGAADTMRQLASIYADNPNFSLTAIDNRLGRGNSKVIDLSQLPDLGASDKQDLWSRLHAALDGEYAQGKISESVYRGFKGPQEP